MRHALFGTLAGRAIVIGAALKLAVVALSLVGPVPPVLRVVDTLGSVAIVVAGAYFVARGLAFAKRRLLWRVRRKLIISYIFIGFVPAILIVAFFMLGGLMLFSNFSSYLVQNELRSLADRAEAIAETTAADISRVGRREAASVLARRQADGEREFPGLSFAVLRLMKPCASVIAPAPAGPDTSSPDPVMPPAATRLGMAGPWAHVEPPGSLPDWMTCAGFHGLLAIATGPTRSPSERAIDARRGFDMTGPGDPVDIVVRGVAVSEPESDPYAVVVDVPVRGALLDRLKRETGVTLTSVESIDHGVTPLAARQDGASKVAAASASSNVPLPSLAFLDYADWATGRRSSLRAQIRMNVSETYDRIVAVEGGVSEFGQGLLLVLVVIGVLFLIIEVLALVAGLALARSITGSVHELFVGTERVRQRDFMHKIRVPARDQLGELAESFNDMTASIETLLVEQAEKKRLEEELRIAHEIQMSLLPQGPLGVPGLSVTALSVPAREVGGDYYDLFPLDDHRVGVLIADVSGKGTSAALYMAELKGLMLSLSQIYASPRDLLIAANRIIAKHLDARSFITMTYAMVDLRARTMTYARAGHTPLIYLPVAGTPARHLQILAPDGLVLGLKLDNGEMFERLLCEDTIPIHAGDLFLLFTDGITEAMDAQDDCFGEARLGQLVEAHAHLPSEELRERVLREIAAFVGDAPQHDDMTMILLRIEEPADEDGIGADVVEVVSA